MTRQTYIEISNRLQGLNLDELRMLQKRVDKLIASETTYRGSPFKKRDGRYVEIKVFVKELKNGQKQPYYYKYYRWRENGKLQSEYIGKPSDDELREFLKHYQPKTKRPAQPKRKAA